MKRLAITLGGAGAEPAAFVRLAQEAEQAGFAVVGAGDAADDSIALLGAISQVTQRVGLRTSVALLGRSPAQLALAAATLQRLSGGRFRLGIGPGSQQRNEGWHGIPYQRMVGRTEEYLRTVRAALAASPAAPAQTSGRFYQLDRFTTGRPPLPVAVDLAANGPRMVQLAGMLADAVLVDQPGPPAVVFARVAPLVRQGEVAAGRPAGSVELSIAVRVAISRDRAEAIAAARADLCYHLAFPYNRALLATLGYLEEAERLEHAATRGTLGQAVARLPDAAVEQLSLCGTAEEVRAGIGRWFDYFSEVRVNPPTWYQPASDLVARYRTVIATFADLATSPH
ncbi:MAG: LLM class F420-dependent oxidoreductase [Dehalococcoidia bacterium]|nr:MAG: LLM class F420-dependent oxidoreductase [Dehalococcoidia bacterium]